MTERTMQAMVLTAPRRPLVLRELPVPSPGPEQVLVEVKACGVCRTDLHIAHGELEGTKLPLVLGHEIVGRVSAIGPRVDALRPGDRVGVPWLSQSCGFCRFCLSNRENLCLSPRFTGFTTDGGYAEYTLAHQRFCFRVPDGFSDEQAAPLLCAGLIGYRSYRMAGDGRRLGLYGFGGAAHILTQIGAFEGREIYAFTKPGDERGQEFARRLGAAWAGDSCSAPPVPLDAAILFAPVGELVPTALAAVEPGGVVVCGGIHMSDIPAFPYRLLWGERVVRSVANLTRRDGEELLALAPRVPIATVVELFRLEQANEALERLHRGQIEGAAVLSFGSR